MKASLQLDLIEQEIIDPETRAALPDRRILLKWLSRELTRLSSLDEWDFLAVRNDPIATLTEGKRNYRLPDEFPTNFLQSFDEFCGEKRYMCKISNGTNDNFLSYASPAVFAARESVADGNGCPTEYTIESTPGGSKEIRLGPPPDSTARTIWGLYVPTNWDIDDEDEVPALPGNSFYLQNSLLARIYERTAPALSAAAATRATQDLNALYMANARNRAAILAPQYNYGARYGRWGH